jgi:hypothetical protein
LPEQIYIYFFGATFHFPDFIVDVAELLVALDEVDEVVGGRVVGRDRLVSRLKTFFSLSQTMAKIS